MASDIFHDNGDTEITIDEWLSPSDISFMRLLHGTELEDFKVRAAQSSGKAILTYSDRLSYPTIALSEFDITDD